MNDIERIDREIQRIRDGLLNHAARIEILENSTIPQSQVAPTPAPTKAKPPPVRLDRKVYIVGETTNQAKYWINQWQLSAVRTTVWQEVQPASITAMKFHGHQGVDFILVGTVNHPRNYNYRKLMHATVLPSTVTDNSIIDWTAQTNG